MTQQIDVTVALKKWGTAVANVENVCRRAAAEALVDFLLSDTFQEDVPLNMFVFPASTTAGLPPAFVDHVVLPEDPHTLAPADIGANRNAWTERWTEIVLR